MGRLTGKPDFRREEDRNPPPPKFDWVDFDHPLCPYQFLADRRFYVHTVNFKEDEKRRPRPLDPDVEQDEGGPLLFKRWPDQSAANFGVCVDPSTIVDRMLLKQTPPETFPCGFDCWLFLSCCAGFKDIVERLEPGLHQFFPFAIEDEKGVPVDQRFFLNPCARRTFYDLERMEFERQAVLTLPKAPYQYDFEQLAGHHLWFDMFAYPGALGGIHVSHELMTAITEAGLKGFEFKRRRKPILRNRQGG